MGRVTIKEWERAGKPAPEEFLKVGDTVPFVFVQMNITNGRDGVLLNEDYTTIAQDSWTSDIIGHVGLYNTFSRQEPGNLNSPMVWRGLCERDSQENKHPRSAPKNFIVSPYRADSIDEKILHKQLAEAVCRHYWMKGDFPIAPHLYFPTFLDDDRPFQRDWGIVAGHCLMEDCDKVTVIEIDGKISEGMELDIQYAVNILGIAPVYLRMTTEEAWKFIKSELGEG